MPEVRAFALKSLDRVLGEARNRRRDWRMWWLMESRAGLARGRGAG